VVISYIIIGAKLHGVHFQMSTWVYCLKRCSLLKGAVRCIVHMFSVISCREFLYYTYDCWNSIWPWE